jgi:hypothetical protein
MSGGIMKADGEKEKRLKMYQTKTVGNEIIYTLNGKEVGKILKNTYISFRESSKHFYIKGRGYPISSDILRDLHNRGVTEVCIVERTKTQTRAFTCELNDYLKCSEFSWGGYDPQRCYPLDKMELIGQK